MSQSVTVSPESSVSPFYGTQSTPVRCSGRRCNLMLVSDPAVNQLEDYQKIAGEVRQIAPNTRPVIIDSKQSRLTGMLLSVTRPTFMFSPVPLARLRPLRGRLLTGQNLSKSEEYSALEKCGVPVPKWRLITADGTPDLAGFHPYVVTKPDRGGRGALVKIKRKGRVRAKMKAREGQSKTGAFTVDEGGELLAQEFVYTGQWPISYRVTTLFGKVLHSFKVEASHQRNPLPGPDAFGSLPDDKGVSIVASSKGCKFSLNYDEEIIRFGEEAHAAFPDIPLLGIDIVREVPSGKLYVLEVNAIGYIWHSSSQTGQHFQREFNFNLEEQFDGLRKAAHILANKTQELAC